MRMWMVHPRGMCKNHLLGEHFETHCFVGHIQKGKSIKGYLENGLLETHRLKQRHDELAQEIRRRGMNHKTPIEQPEVSWGGFIDVEKSTVELHRRCSVCCYRWQTLIASGKLIKGKL